jgi:hypothetical protein
MFTETRKKGMVLINELLHPEGCLHGGPKTVDSLLTAFYEGKEADKDALFEHLLFSVLR